MTGSASVGSMHRQSLISEPVKPDKRRSCYLYWLTVVVLISVGVWLRSPVLDGTRISDDWDHYAMITGTYPVKRSPLDLYNFIGAPAADRAALLQSGRLPWWSDSDVRISFVRPLASFFVYADYAWFGAEQQPQRAHLHSLVWWALSLIGAAAVFRLILPASLAVLSLGLFAVDEGHSLPVAWSASRAEVIASALMMGSLWSFISWSMRRQARFGWLTFAFTTLALSAGEHALSLVPYLAAFGLFGVRAALKERLWRLVSFGAPVLAYLIVHVYWGYGVRGSGFYADPFGDLGGYLAVLPERLAYLLADVVWGYSADWSFTTPSWIWFLLARGVPASWLMPESLLAIQGCLGAAAAVLLMAAWVMLRRRADDPVARPLSWLLLGAAGSLLPLTSAFAMTRLTVAPALGVDTFVAWLLSRSFVSMRSWMLPRRLGWGAVLAGITWQHGLLSASRSHAASAMYAAWSRHEEAWVLGAQFGDGNLRQQHVLLLSALDTASQYALPVVLRSHGLPAPSVSQILLPPALAPLQLQRTAANVIEVTASDPNGHAGFLNSAYRRARATFATGQHFSNPHFEVEIVRAVRGLPATVRYTFPRALDDPQYVFMHSRSEGLRRLELPTLGEARVIPAPAAPSMESNGAGR